MVKARRVPSGDHSTLDGLFCTRVTCVTRPSSSIQRTKIWLPPGSPSAVKAMRVPSGDHCGEEPSTRKRFLLPSAFMIQIEDARRSLILSTSVRVYRISLASGDSWGLPHPLPVQVGLPA